MTATVFTKEKIFCGLSGKSSYRTRGRFLAGIIALILIPACALAQGPTLISVEATPLNYDEGQASTVISSSITAVDPDSPTLASATVQITSNFASAEDLLEFTDAFSITGSYDAVTGTMSLTGPATLADITSALRSVKYRNTNNDHPSNLVRTISFTVNDGTSNSLVVTRDIQVNRINDLPVGQDDSFVMDEDTDLDCGCLLTNDSDPDGDPLIALLASPPAHGTVKDEGGFFIYTPHENYYGTDSFTYYANDGTGNSQPILVNITVLPVNDAPEAKDDAMVTDEDVPVAIPVLANDKDVDDVLIGSMIVIVSPPVHGTVTINTTTGNAEYSPGLNYNGSDSFTYQVKDAGNALSNVATVSITINPVNDTPVAIADAATTPEDTPVSISVLANDTDVESSLDPASLVIVSGPAHGTAVVQPVTGTISYSPAANYTGSDSFTYQVEDATGLLSNIATVNITVTPVNDAPIANPDVASTPEDQSVPVAVLANDTDVDNALSTASVIVSTPANGTAVFQPATGTVLYTPNSNYTGSDSFTYQIKDANNALSNVATVTVTVTPVNDKPVANADAATTPEETPISIPVLANDTDIEGGLNTTSLTVGTGPAHGSVDIEPTTGIILYTPEKDFTGDDSFTYTVADLQGAVSAPATVTLTVTPINDPPVAVDDAATTDKNVTVTISILANDYDVDNEVVKTSVALTTTPAHGQVIYHSTTGVVYYTPENGYVGNDSFTYTIQDPDGLTSAPATVTVTVLAAENQPPVAVDDGPIENSYLSPINIDVLENDYDVDNAHDELSIVSVSNPSSGTVSIVNGVIVYQPVGLVSGVVTFTYTIQDPAGLTDEATVTIENDFPSLAVSEGFSPNNDANNDTWYIQGIENYPNNSIKIFDRWGFLVYQKQHYENTTAPWDGRGNASQQSGKLLDQGTYYYILEPGGEMKTMTGYVVIVR